MGMGEPGFSTEGVVQRKELDTDEPGKSEARTVNQGPEAGDSPVESTDLPGRFVQSDDSWSPAGGSEQSVVKVRRGQASRSPPRGPPRWAGPADDLYPVLPR